MAQSALPIVSGAASMFGGLFGGRRFTPTAPGFSERTSVRGGLGSGRNLMQQGSQLFDLGGQNLAGVHQFLTPLLFGDRAAARNLLRPQLNAISDQEAGILRSLSGRGGQQRVAEDQLRAQRFTQQSNLVGQARNTAAQLAANLGTTLTGQGTAATQAGGGIFNSLANTLAQARLQQDQLRLQGMMGLPTGGEEFGKGIFEMVRGLSGGALPSRPVGTGNVGLIPSPPRSIDTSQIPGRRTRTFFPVGAYWE